MQKDEIKSILLSLMERRDKSNDDFIVDKFPKTKNHKIGLNKAGNCSILLKAIPSKVPNNIKLDPYKHFNILFNKRCQIRGNDDSVEESNFTVIQLYEDDSDLQIFFIDLCSKLIYQIGDNPSLQDIYEAIKQLLELFRKIIAPSKATIQGLWSELLLIESSSDPDYLIKSWHINPTDTFDFNDGITKIEVKSTLKSERIHRFSNKQLTPDPHNHVASTFVLETGLGKSIIDLMESIGKRVGAETYVKMTEVIFDTLGEETKSIGAVKFDYNFSLNSFNLYKSNSIPNIKNIPNFISNISFDVNLSNIDDETNKEGKLLKLLNI